MLFFFFCFAVWISSGLIRMFVFCSATRKQSAVCTMGAGGEGRIFSWLQCLPGYTAGRLLRPRVYQVSQDQCCFVPLPPAAVIGNTHSALQPLLSSGVPPTFSSFYAPLLSSFHFGEPLCSHDTLHCLFL